MAGCTCTVARCDAHTLNLRKLPNGRTLHDHECPAAIRTYTDPHTAESFRIIAERSELAYHHGRGDDCYLYTLTLSDGSTVRLTDDEYARTVTQIGT